MHKTNPFSTQNKTLNNNQITKNITNFPRRIGSLHQQILRFDQKDCQILCYFMQITANLADNEEI